MKTTTKRAKKGGEIGANGEFYEGGKFISTVEHNPKRFGSSPKPVKLRKVRINLYDWVEQETPDQKPIFSLVGTATRIDRSGKMEIYLPPFESNCSYAGPPGMCFGVSLEQAQKYCDRYNAGEVWM